MKIIQLFLLFFIATHVSMALEVDEKLTLRILRLSSTKKTILVNRGLEDALAQGDHAKFFLTTGVIARGVVVDISPTRSIWSLYRIVDPNAVVSDKLINIKISMPVKLTDDPSKSIYAKHDSSFMSSSIPLAEGADDLDGGDDSEEDEDFLALTRSLETSGSDFTGIQAGKTFELFSLLHYNLLTTSSDVAMEDSAKETQRGINFSVGVEKYFAGNINVLKNISLLGIFHMGEHNSSYNQNTESSVSFVEYGGGLNYHFLGHPQSYNRPIGFIGILGGVGTTKDTLTHTTENPNDEVEGTSVFYALGIGIKYFTQQGLGGKIMAEFYQRSEEYAFETRERNYTRKVMGPRIQVGISYRF